MTQRPFRKEDAQDPWPAEVTPLSQIRREQRENATRNPNERARERARARDASARRELSPSGERLARWLQEHDIQGGDELCRDYGPQIVIDALHRDKIITLVKDDHSRRFKWVVNPKWHSPGGFLVSQLRKRYGWRRD